MGTEARPGPFGWYSDDSFSEVNGSSDENVSQEQLNQAVEIIRQRVDGAGVSEAEVTTSFGSGNNVVVSVPGTISAETRQLIQGVCKYDVPPGAAFWCRYCGG